MVYSTKTLNVAQEASNCDEYWASEPVPLVLVYLLVAFFLAEVLVGLIFNVLYSKPGKDWHHHDLVLSHSTVSDSDTPHIQQQIVFHLETGSLSVIGFCKRTYDQSMNIFVRL